MQQNNLTEQILEFRRTDDTFRKSLKERSQQRSFRFYDGPPFTSGDPHYGHLLQSSVKDMVPRRMTMRGYRVERKRGWDCHGIPAENFVNKQLGITSKKQVEAEYGVGPYVEACRSMVNQVNDNRKWFVDHVGRWVDMENAYFTMDNDFIESVMWVFSDLYNKNLIYKGFKVLGYSRSLGTALSASEIAEGYEDRQDPAVTVRFKIQNRKHKVESIKLKKEQGTSRDDGGPVEVVCAIIKNEKGEYVMLYDTRIGNWMFPGGKMEVEESKEEAIVRELKEELGVDTASQSFRGTIPYVHKNKIFVLHYIDVTISGEIQNLEPEKHSDIKRVGKIAHDNAHGFAIKIENTLIDDEDQIQQDFVDFLNLEKGLIGLPELADAPVYFLARTTTPWTLPSNMFLAVNPNLLYVQVYDVVSKCYYIVAKNLLHKYFKNPAEYHIIYQMKGKGLVGLRYEPLFDYIEKLQTTNHKLQSEVGGLKFGVGAYFSSFFQVLPADFVTDDAGTGIAHEAPAFGELDYNLVSGFLGRDTASEWLFNPVDDNGDFTSQVPEWEGMNVITASLEITKFLKHRGDIIKHETINHSYPHCPRTGTPLIYRAMESRFVKEEQLKEKTVPSAEKINFVPQSIRNRFVEGLKSAPDRNISRSRYWGAPLPVWVPENGEGEALVLGTREEVFQWSKTGSKNLTKFVFTRHGETDFNVEKGAWDAFGHAVLTELGNQQAKDIIEILLTKNIAVDVFVVSPFKRTFQTAIPLLKQVLGSDFEAVEQQYLKYAAEFSEYLQKYGFQSFYADASIQKLIKLHEQVYLDYRIAEIMVDKKYNQLSLAPDVQGEYCPTWSDMPATPGGESVKAVYRRVKESVDACGQLFVGKTVMMFNHAMTLRMLRMSIQEYDFDVLRKDKVRRKNHHALPEVHYYDVNTKQGLDLHRPYIDNIRFIKDGVKYSRIPEVLDCWFESGSMPYGAVNYTGEKPPLSPFSGGEEHLLGSNKDAVSVPGGRGVPPSEGGVGEGLGDLVIIDNLSVDRREEFKNLRLEAVQDVAAFGSIKKYEYEAAQDEKYWKEKLSNPDNHFVFLESEGKLVGMIKMGVLNIDVGKVDASGMRVSNVFVQPAYRGKGLAGILVNQCKKIAISLGASALYLQVIQSNTLAIHSYEKAGFITIKERKTDVYGSMVDMYVMESAIVESIKSKVESKEIASQARNDQGTLTIDHGQLTTDNGQPFNPTANFIAEGLDQTRGWFRALHVLGTAVMDTAVFENVVVTGMILAEDGKKMSKSKKNFPDPKILLEQYGPDAFRFYLMSSPVVRSEPLRFKEKDVEQVLKDVLLPLHNVVNFFTTYAKVDNFKHPGTEIYFMRHADAVTTMIETKDHNGDIIVEDARTIKTPLSEKGEKQLVSEKFVEEVGRLMPDIILSSNFTRAIQTSEGVQKVMKNIYNKEVEIVIDEKFAKALKSETVSEIYKEILDQYSGKKVLLISHNRRFLRLWNHLMGTSISIEVEEHKKQIRTSEIIRLPLVSLLNELDQRIYSELYTLIEKLDIELAGYRLDTATNLLTGFIEKITNWYLRRSRRRFRANGMDADKLAAYYTLYEVTTIYLKLLAPFAPFTTEYLWKSLQDFSMIGDKNHSIHLEYRPLPSSKFINAELMEEIETVRTIIKQALFIRAKNQIKVKIPLRKMEVKISSFSGKV